MSVFAGDLFIYWLLECILLLTCILCGGGITKSKDNPELFWKLAAIVIIVFTFVKGLRYGRGVDYITYADSITSSSLDNEMYILEPVWFAIVYFFRYFKINPIWFFVFNIFILIFSFTRIVKHVPKLAVWALPMFYIIFGPQSETMVRQDCAISFLMLAYSFYLDKRKIPAIVFVVLSFFTHFSAFTAILPIFIILLLTNRKKDETKENKVLAPYILVFIYILLELFWRPAYLDSISRWITILNFLNIGGKQGYIEQAEDFFGSQDVYGSESIANSIPFILTHFLANVVIIFLGYKYMQKNKDMRVAYCFAVIAIYVNLIGGSIQLWQRMVNWFIYLTPLIIGGIVCEIDYKKSLSRIFVIATFFMCYYFYYIKYIGSIPPLGYAFIWDV